MDKVQEMESLIQAIETQVADLTKQHDRFDQLENTLDENLEAARLSKEYAYLISTVYLAQQKLAGKLDPKDPILKNMKRIQEKDSRIKKVETALAEKEKKQAEVRPETYQKHFGKGELLRKRSRPDTSEDI
jgi:uncharacterized protein (DUF3084 family)